MKQRDVKVLQSYQICRCAASGRALPQGAPIAHLHEAVVPSSIALLCWFVFFLIANLIYTPLVEERGLENRFGKEHIRYKKNVPRWIARLRPRCKTWPEHVVLGLAPLSAEWEVQGDLLLSRDAPFRILAEYLPETRTQFGWRVLLAHDRLRPAAHPRPAPAGVSPPAARAGAPGGRPSRPAELPDCQAPAPRSCHLRPVVI